MAPTDQALEKALANAVHALRNSDDGSSMTVNSVRKRVEEELGLEDGFFLQGDWKLRSKLLIKSTNVCAFPTPATWTITVPDKD